MPTSPAPPWRTELRAAAAASLTRRRALPAAVASRLATALAADHAGPDDGGRRLVDACEAALVWLPDIDDDPAAALERALGHVPGRR